MSPTPGTASSRGERRAKLDLYARNLAPLLREQNLDDDDVDLSHVVLSHYRLSKIKQQDLRLEEEGAPTA